MDVQQIGLGYEKSMLNSNSIERLISFVQNIEEKLLSVKTIHEKFQQLIFTLSKSHENILQELTIIKTVLNEQKSNDQQINPIDEKKCLRNDEEVEEVKSKSSMKEFQSKSLTNLNSKDEQNHSPSTHPTDRLSLYSASSYASSSSSTNSLTIESRPNSSSSKRSSNLKKSDQYSTRAKSPKSVTFHLEDNKHSRTSIQNQEQTNNQSIEQFSNEINIPTTNEIIKPNEDLITDLFKQHHYEVTNKSNIGFKLGNALTNVRIHEIESTNGDYLRLLNISNSDDYDLSGHFLQQNIACVPISRFRFPSNTIIRAGQTVTVWCGSLRDVEPQPPHIFLWKEQRRWETGSECVTILAKPTGQAIAWARSSHRINTDQSSSDILFVHSKGNIPTADTTITTTTNSLKTRSRLSAFHFIGNNKPPFAHSPSNPIHPDHNGTFSNIPNDLRSQIYQRGGISQLLNRPKSSPFASHTGCKQDLISMNFLRKQQTQENKQTTLKT